MQFKSLKPYVNRNICKGHMNSIKANQQEIQGEERKEEKGKQYFHYINTYIRHKKYTSQIPQLMWSNSFKAQQASVDEGIRKLNKTRDEAFSLNGAWSY